MNALTLKSIPESLIESLRVAATSAHRSLNKEIINRLERSFVNTPRHPDPDEWSSARVNEQADAWENLDGRWESDLSLEAEIEAMYAARTPGRDVPAL
jgi:plasmid stability protein